MTRTVTRRELEALVKTRYLEYALVAIYAAIVGFATRRHVFGDDAAITFRYVERLISGHGLTYNDHERVLGTSNPLYALLLSLFTWIIRDVQAVTLAFGLFTLAASAALSTYLASHLSKSRVAGLVAGLVLATDGFYRGLTLYGLESGLAALLGLATSVAVLEQRDTLTGILLGLCVWNKLDGGIIAAALVGGILVFQRRWPIRIVTSSVLTVLPWVLFAWAYYGSPLPHSFVAKLLLQHTGVVFNHLWIWNFLTTGHNLYLFVVSMVSLVVLGLCLERPTERTTVVTLGGWLLVHAIVFSTMSLGDHYGWYLTVLVPPMIVLSAALIGFTFVRFGTTWKRSAAIGVCAAVVFWLSISDSAREMWNDIAEGDPLKAPEAFDGDRQLAGIFLGQYADPSEILACAYGWPAFESGLRTNDTSLLNSKQMGSPVSYRVEHASPAESVGRGPSTPLGYIPLAHFNLANDLFSGYSWFTVFGTPDSSIARLGARYLQYRLFELPPPRAYSPERGLEHVQATGNDLLAQPPSGAAFVVANAHQPVHVVFVPGFAPNVVANRGDGVTFELYANDKLVYRRHVRPGDGNDRTIVDVDGARSRDRVEIAFVTGSGRVGNPSHDLALWKSVKVVIGDAYIDPFRIREPQMMEAWQRANPSGPSDRWDQYSRRLAIGQDVCP